MVDYKPGDLYTIVNVPMNLYYDSGKAANKDLTSSGKITTAGQYRIAPDANIFWTTSSGGYYTTKPATNPIALLAIQDRPYGTWYTIGWVREDDNASKTTIGSVPSTLSVDAANYKVVLDGTNGSVATVTATIGNTTIHTETVTLSASNKSRTYTFTTAQRNAIYSALGNNMSGTMTVTVTSTYNGLNLGSDSKNINLTISGGAPSFTTTVTALNRVNNNYYQNLSSVQVSIGTVTYSHGASFKSRRITVGGETSTSSPFTSSVFTTIGSVTITSSVTDTKNRTTTNTTTINVLPLISINITEFTSQRLADNRVQVTGKGTFSSSIDGSQPKYTIHRREIGATAWTSSLASTNVPVNGDNFSINLTFSTTAFSPNKGYEILLTVTGSTTQSTAMSTVGTEVVSFSIGDYGAGIGTMFDNSKAWNLQVGSGGINSGGPISVGNNTVFHSGNDGASSGLDADLLDGMHLSEILSQIGSGSGGDSGGGSSNITSGQNSNGRWYQVGDSLLICTINDTLDTVHDGNWSLYDTWTYPKPFLETPIVFPMSRANRTDAANLTTGYIHVEQGNTSTATIWWYRAGGSAFANGNKKYISAMAIGIPQGGTVPTDPTPPVDPPSGSPIRYIRLHNKRSDSANGRVVEFEAWADSTNVASGKTVSISGGTILDNPQYVTDGNRGIYIAANYGGTMEGIYIDLGQSYTNIDRFNYLKYGGLTYAEDWIEVSNDNSTWRRVYQYNATQPTNTTDTYGINIFGKDIYDINTPVRYVRVGGRRNAVDNFQPAEIEIWRGSTNLMAGKSVSGGITITNPVYINDGTRSHLSSTLASTNHSQLYVEVDLGQAYTDLTRINYLVYYTLLYEHAWVAVSEDGQTWKTIHRNIGFTHTANWAGTDVLANDIYGAPKQIEFTNAATTTNTTYAGSTNIWVNDVRTSNDLITNFNAFTMRQWAQSAGLNIKSDALKANTNYTIAFKAKKRSGNVANARISGNAFFTGNYKFSIDGKEISSGTTLSGDLNITSQLNDGQWHSFVYNFRTPAAANLHLWMLRFNESGYTSEVLIDVQEFGLYESYASF